MCFPEGLEDTPFTSFKVSTLTKNISETGSFSIIKKHILKRSIFQTFWKTHCCTKFLFFELTSPELHHRLCFDQGFLF